jgi:benzoyl-CoA 2,3-dioxygenase component B
MNEVLRDEYVKDNLKGIEYWNRVCEKAGVAFRFSLPHRRFNRKIGAFAGARFDPQGNLLSEEEWQRRCGDWLPTEEDRAYVASLMKPVLAPGQFADWIAPPAKGINSQPIEHLYVKL